MYFIDNANLKESADANSKDVAEIKKSIDVKLLELPNEEWCKVSFDGIEGYIKTSNLTSSYTTPNIVEKNRIQRILLKVNINMELNKVSGLTLNDYKKYLLVCQMILIKYSKIIIKYFIIWKRNITLMVYS